MNQVFAGATALMLALILWGFGKKNKISLISKTDPHHLDGLPLQQAVLVEVATITQAKANKAQSKNGINWQPPTTIQGKLKLQKQIANLISGDPQERLQAITLSDLWGHATILPILRRGLKDSDSRVIKAAANAIQKHRGVPNCTSLQLKGTSKPPRNVARMR